MRNKTMYKRSIHQRSIHKRTKSKRTKSKRTKIKRTKSKGIMRKRTKKGGMFGRTECVRKPNESGTDGFCMSGKKGTKVCWATKGVKSSTMTGCARELADNHTFMTSRGECRSLSSIFHKKDIDRYNGDKRKLCKALGNGDIDYNHDIERWRYNVRA